MSEPTHVVYTAWDADDRPLYIGCSKNLPKRIKSHTYEKSPWIPYAVRYTTEGPFPEAEALRIERERIVTVRPYFNWQPEYAKGLKEMHRVYGWQNRQATARVERKFGMPITRDGRHRLYLQVVRAQKRAARLGVAA